MTLNKDIILRKHFYMLFKSVLCIVLVEILVASFICFVQEAILCLRPVYVQHI